MNHTQWKTTRTRRLAGENVEPSAAYVEAGYALALGEALYGRRTALGLTQGQVAERAGMSQPKVSMIEGGGHVPTLPLLQRLAKALDSRLAIDLDEESPSFDFRPLDDGEPSVGTGHGSTPEPTPEEGTVRRRGA
ncbi:helix-turn-helix domain-containing protein [Streptomyces kunmingensis]|uniref:Helix-turn-helix domain-containing protein n=1 Tax=Streptomyces kunmingensis TaxID=68225 RepID=A0ABU6CCH1_9ACTN|nr:helix-turn-helix transcriptional regulator [Streptomyces kunmingensis]MEB3962409.1 helix-turn-helix domain-containing protein [Streptomyces kunmingensis]